MKGAIFYASKYGSTTQYANWIAESTGLPVFDAIDGDEDPSKYEFLILGSPIIYFKLSIHKWLKKHWAEIKHKPILFYSVSGSPAGKKLDGWISKSLSQEMISQIHFEYLQGRQIPEELTLFDRTMLQVAGLFNPDREIGKQESKGFDYMDKNDIEPIVKWVHEIRAKMEVT